MPALDLYCIGGICSQKVQRKNKHHTTFILYSKDSFSQGMELTYQRSLTKAECVVRRERQCSLF